MFPSSGLFSRLNCPISRRGCGRVHCWYKHAENVRCLSTNSPPSLRSSLAGAHYSQPSVWGVSQVADDVTDDLDELHRLNKEIEVTKYEVEQEQRRLSDHCATHVAPTGAEVQNSNDSGYGQRNTVKEPSQSRKYVVDNSRPRTDMEYDPMSNFTAEFASLTKTLKGKGLHQCGGNKPVSQQTCSNEVQNHTDDDGILIIDMTLSPDRKSAKADLADSDFDVHVGPALEAQEKSFGVSADALIDLIDLTQSAEDLDGKGSDTSVCSQSAVEGTAQHHISDSYEEPLAVELPDRVETMCSVECQPSKESVEELGSTANCTMRPSHQEPTGDDNVIVIDSSSDEDHEDLYMELSDSDPLEECYRIFMEANNEELEHHEQLELPMKNTAVVMASKDEIPAVQPQEWPEKREIVHESKEIEVKNTAVVMPSKVDIPVVRPQEGPEKRRIAHESKGKEIPLAKRKPEPQILVPFRGPANTAPTSQQKIAIVKATVKGNGVIYSPVDQRKQDIQAATVISTPAAAVTTLPTHHNAYANYVALGSTVLNVGNNLHLILPQGAVPITSNSSGITSVLTPITSGCPGSVVDKTASTSVLRHRSVTPMLIPATPLRPSRHSLAMVLSTAAGNASSRMTSKPVATKRKGKQQQQLYEAKTKVPHDIRQRYVTQFTEAFLDTVTDVDEAFKKAVAEEKAVYNRSINKLKYLSVAVNALKRLKRQNCVTSKDEKVNGKTSKGCIQLNWKKLKPNGDSSLYDFLRDYILSEEELVERNFPIQHPEKASSAVLFANKKASNDPLKRICCRCGAMYSVNKAGKHTRMEECNYHYGKGVEKRVPGGVETRYSCCQGVMGAPPCQIFKLHVHDSLEMDGFVSSSPRHPQDSGCPGVYALDCETCYTIQGLELLRVTVVDSSLQVIYDTYLKPRSEVIDYNTRFSGISEEDMMEIQTSIAEVQKTLLSFIRADTILIGHGLEADLCALKLLHGTVVDTAAVFPHRLGPPHRLSLNRLTAEYLTRIIQESVCGHDTAEDATACMELMLMKRKDAKGKK
ncbi:uncharacterized protein LOC144195336 isoform X2 [Stigmatopora nigra]